MDLTNVKSSFNTRTSHLPSLINLLVYPAVSVEFVIEILKKAAKLANEAEARCPDRFKVSPL